MKAALVLLLDVDEDNVDALQPAYEAIAGAQLDGARHLHAFIRDCAEDLLDNLPPCCAEAMTPDPARAELAKAALCPCGVERRACVEHRDEESNA